MLSNCSEEDDFITEPQPFGFINFKHRNVSVFDDDNIPKIIKDFIHAETLGSNQVVMDKSTEGFTFSKSSARSQTFGTIDETQSIAVALGTQNRYSFLVKPHEARENELINLVILEDEESADAYFIKFTRCS